MPRPAAAPRTGDRLKLHRRRIRLAGRDFTVITLRPGTDARFSTNHYHGTWHILSDYGGARLLARLLWGLAYQRVPGTLVLLDRPFLDPNPFDAAPSDPIALVPPLLTPLDGKAAKALRRRLPLSGAPDGTVTWQTPGLPAAVAARRTRYRRAVGVEPRPWIPPEGFQERVDRVGGLVTWAAVPAVLKEYAAVLATLGDPQRYAWRGIDDVEVDRPNGEVQVFRDYRRRVSAARVARRELLAELAAVPAPDSFEMMVWQRGTEVRARRLRPGRNSRVRC